MNKTWQCSVLVKVGDAYPAQPRVMTTQARNLMEARAYFQTFGKLLNEPRIIGD